MTCRLVYIVEQETGLRRDGVRVSLRQKYKTWIYNVTVPIIAGCTSSCMCLAAGEVSSRFKARAHVKKILAIYDAEKLKRRSLRETADNARRALVKARVEKPLGWEKEEYGLHT